MAREDVPTLSLSNNIAWRYSNYDTPFWARSNTRAGRWNIAREASVQYLTMEPNAAWAELIRAEDLRSEADIEMVRMPIWVAAIHEVVVDYSTFQKAEEAGFPPDALIDDDWSRCQEEGRRLRELGFAGVIAPSAALPGTANVTIFGARILGDWTRRFPTFGSSVPATIAAVGSPCPGLVDRVRFFGDEHSEYDEYARIEAVRASPPPQGATGSDPESQSGSQN